MKSLVLFFLLCLSFWSTAQSRLYGSVIAGTYQMGDMKALQRDIRDGYIREGIPVKSVTSFSASLQGELGYEIRLRKITLGGFVNYAMTEGRIAYADYSGAMAATQQLKRVALGVKFMRDLGHHLHLYGKLGVCKTFLDIKSETNFSTGHSYGNGYSFDAVGATFEPGVEWEHDVKRFTFFAQAGYEINVNGKTKYDDNIYLENSNNEAIHVNWSGVRVAIGTAFWLRKRD
ncbi:hypothetical protein SAMN04488109_0722 [Chryseolinea serpens]|uniref:Outer membrane protein beta-barrel domain-containing protein n=1 Tax=Chryseolinea serpens TaxID=947013 RepID=A0A1M5KM51_9BACT|nr:hypothetical protein [Chryseolinea serpens]SHG53780.1 hypothetical protein SAMN04488109_0722 [Chryseolinea serpens]